MKSRTAAVDGHASPLRVRYACDRHTVQVRLPWRILPYLRPARTVVAALASASYRCENRAAEPLKPLNERIAIFMHQGAARAAGSLTMVMQTLWAMAADQMLSAWPRRSPGVSHDQLPRLLGDRDLQASPCRSANRQTARSAIKYNPALSRLLSARCR